jgi:hypothetical protein
MNSHQSNLDQQTHSTSVIHFTFSESLLDDQNEHENILYDPIPYVPIDTSVHHGSEAIVDSAVQRDAVSRFKSTNPCPTECAIERFHHSSRPAISTTCSKQTKHNKNKPRHPPPNNELLIGHHENDVISGRGATINAHPGNVKFRKLCISKKHEFDTATNAHKRTIAMSVVEEIMKMDPPGRFLERVDDATSAAFEEQYMTLLDADTGIDKIMNGAPLAYFKSIVDWNAKNKWNQHVGPWRDIGVEKAIQKVCGVIRDYKRPDKVALRAMSVKKRKSASVCAELQICLLLSFRSSGHVTYSHLAGR